MLSVIRFETNSTQSIRTEVCVHPWINLGNLCYILSKTSLRLRHTMGKATLQKKIPCVSNESSGMVILVYLLKTEHDDRLMIT
jgi:hypothetical protein